MDEWLDWFGNKRYLLNRQYKVGLYSDIRHDAKPTILNSYFYVTPLSIYTISIYIALLEIQTWIKNDRGKQACYHISHPVNKKTLFVLTSVPTMFVLVTSITSCENCFAIRQYSEIVNLFVLWETQDIIQRPLGM